MKNESYLNFLADTAYDFWHISCNAEKKMKNAILNYILELQDSDEGYVEFQNEFPAFSEFGSEFDSAIYGVRVRVEYNDSGDKHLTPFIYTNESGSKLDMDINDEGWFNPIHYGNIDWLSILDVLKELN